MPEKPPKGGAHGWLAILAWIPILLSLVLLLGFLPFVLLNGVVCLRSWLPIPLFVAYVCLWGFPLFSFLAGWWHTKKFSIGFETKRKEILLAFLIWSVLMLWMLGSFLVNQQVPFPGFDSLLACRIG